MLDVNIMKKLLAAFMDLFTEDFPVLYTPFPIYSNVINGVGIFGAINIHTSTFLSNK